MSIICFYWGYARLWTINLIFSPKEGRITEYLMHKMTDHIPAIGERHNICFYGRMVYLSW